MVVTATTITTYAQVFDSIAIISPDYEIEDLTSKGTTLYAALGLGGVWYSDDEGYTWTQASPLPDAGFGQEGAYSIFAASNGDLIVGGNLVYNNAPLSGVVFRSSDDGASWTAENFDGLGGYEESGKIVELSNGDLMMKGGQGKLFISSLTNPVWTQTNAPGGDIFGFEQIDDIIFVVNNPAGGTAGTWTTTDQGQTWWPYGSNGTPVGLGTVTIAPVLKSGDYKFIGIGGTYDPRGMYRSGVNDTLWVEKKTMG
ncbi:MAG: glycoside hydrolase [Bacteroidales bacterium]|nr:glycoside hydrolase [Bacteroidales bacterium]